MKKLHNNKNNSNDVLSDKTAIFKRDKNIAWEVTKGRYLSRNAIIGVVKNEHKIYSIRKRLKLTKHPIRFMICGCSDPNCSGWHRIDLTTIEPNENISKEILKNKHKICKRKKLTSR